MSLVREKSRLEARAFVDFCVEELVVVIGRG